MSAGSASKRSGVIGITCALTILLLAGCASSDLTESGRLSSYAGLVASSNALTRTRFRIDREAVLAARTVRLMPTIIANGAEAGLTPAQLSLVSNVIDRGVCRSLGERFVVTGQGEPADMEVQAVITRIVKTDTDAARFSVATGIGTQIAGSVIGVPLRAPRLPVGLGSLTVEAEARNRDGRQVAALVWARGADAITTGARVSEEADAHTLAASFATHLSRLLLSGEDPTGNALPGGLPNAQGISDYFGGDARHAACARFGKYSAFSDGLAARLGLPPELTDEGAQKSP